MAAGYVPGFTSQCPSHDKVAVVAGGAITAEIHRLQTKAVVLSCCNGPASVRATDVAYELHRQLRIPHWCITVSAHKPENFLVRFDYPD
jgi:hypothetical protein